MSDDQSAEKAGCGRNTVQRLRQRFANGGLEAALEDRERSGSSRRLLDSKAEQQVVALACTAPLKGAKRWTLELMVQAVQNHKIAATISAETVRQILMRHDLKPWLKKKWCIPQLNKEYTSRMLDVLAVYEGPYDSAQPVVCVDEKSFQLLASKRPALALGSGKARCEDYEDCRKGTANAFVAVEPLGGQRHVRITKQRRSVDFAAFNRFMVMEKYATAHKVGLVTDNLNTHFAKRVITTFGEEEAEQILSRIEWHYTPKHGSWLNMAELEINVLSRQCLAGRMACREEAIRQVRAWQRRRNLAKRGICWEFTQAKAKQVFKLE